ncbi:unnamed protein product [Nesidiocoris tenuis]|uniref:Uncharacterized protein n=1 Tax=Nesidiocoris tenuis TaxID=355587 RepID=A0A6H5H5B1_9HEMI|nr:unnamed protein product [Nesidiocoris tenuis]CAB0011206.1 unnamed protein product [Nesidiocoris tenuis]
MYRMNFGRFIAIPMVGCAAVEQRELEAAPFGGRGRSGRRRSPPPGGTGSIVRWLLILPTWSKRMPDGKLSTSVGNSRLAEDPTYRTMEPVPPGGGERLRPLRPRPPNGAASSSRCSTAAHPTIGIAIKRPKFIRYIANSFEFSPRYFRYSEFVWIQVH